ncbi:hypothetical protein C8R44DRAFT_991370 [Mycena epipterygia]|nr:hypothetical protein C8R44DRAFT_991370 [Mycena epipterygia]
MDSALTAFNLDFNPGLVAAKFGLLSGEDAGSMTTMDLKLYILLPIPAAGPKSKFPFSRHNLVEHDASISDNDWGNGTGDNLHFNETTFSVLASRQPRVM